MRGKLLLLLFVLVLGATAVEAARIYGTVYNIELDAVKNARVEINTQPKQVYVATDGTYAFTVPAGSYTLTARVIKNGTTTAFASEQVTVAKDGNYVLDLIVFPDFEDDILNTTDDINLDEAQFDEPHWTEFTIVAFLLALAIVAVILWQRRAQQHVTHETQEHKPEPTKEIVATLPATERDDAKEVVDFIKSQGGRTTQKDIRKHSSLSEAKISLIITELEHKGIIEKIKKGRGNVIVLK